MRYQRECNKAGPKFRFCHCRQIVPPKFGIRSFERPQLGMASGTGSRSAYSQPRHSPRRARACIIRPKVDRQRCSREKHTVTGESKTDISNTSKKASLETG